MRSPAPDAHAPFGPSAQPSCFKVIRPYRHRNMQNRTPMTGRANPGSSTIESPSPEDYEFFRSYVIAVRRCKPDIGQCHKSVADSVARNFALNMSCNGQWSGRWATLSLAGLSLAGLNLTGLSYAADAGRWVFAVRLKHQNGASYECTVNVSIDAPR